MNELVRVIRHFVTRDVLYIVGGGIVMAAFLYLFDRLPASPLPSAYYLLSAGVAYAIGFALQELSSLLGIVRTSLVRAPPPAARWLYDRYKEKGWKDVSSDVDLESEYRLAVHEAEGELGPELQRTITMKHVGTTIGPSALVGSALLLGRTLLDAATGQTIGQVLFSGSLFLASLAVALTLVGMAWVLLLYQVDQVCEIRGLARGVDSHVKGPDGSRAARDFRPSKSA